MTQSNPPVASSPAASEASPPSLYRPNRHLPRPVSTVLDPLQPIPDRKKRLPLQILGLLAALLLLGLVAAAGWLLARPADMSAADRVMQARTSLGDLVPDTARPLSTSKRVQAP